MERLQRQVSYLLPFSCNQHNFLKKNYRLRSLAFNLKDPKNPLLRARLLSRELDPSQLPPMSSTDLVSYNNNKL